MLFTHENLSLALSFLPTPFFGGNNDKGSGFDISMRSSNFIGRDSDTFPTTSQVSSFYFFPSHLKFARKFSFPDLHRESRRQKKSYDNPNINELITLNSWCLN